VDRNAPRWPREQAADRIRQRIKAGELGPKLPSHRELAEEMGVAPRTLDRALKILADEGLIYSIAGLGTFISEAS
jgi:DNA-binding GntR family transcriptional regulator